MTQTNYTLESLAAHLGWGCMSAKDAFLCVCERERLLRLAQIVLQTEKSNAATAEAALMDRIAAIKRSRAERLELEKGQP